MTVPPDWLCYVHAAEPKDEAADMLQRGFTLKQRDRAEWTAEEKRMLIAGLSSAARQRDFTVKSKSLWYHVSTQILDNAKTPDQCRRFVRGMLLRDDRCDIAKFCASELNNAAAAAAPAV